tara:strand:- start:50 stop:301 length:252 start_codon:yes stop_codon:yes gene_type:complete
MFDNTTLYIVCHGPQSEWVICDTLLDALQVRDIFLKMNPKLTRKDIHIRSFAPITSKSDPKGPKRVDHFMTSQRLSRWLEAVE